jgi:very-short-patch-repair endonuclease
MAVPQDTPPERIGRKLRKSCSECGAVVWTTNRYQQNFYCGLACRKIGLSRRFNKQVECICGQCGKTFCLPHAWTKRGGGKFCSQDCYTDHQRANPHGGNGRPAKPNKKYKCHNCQAVFHASDRRKTTDYCSLECRRAGTHLAKHCPTCDRVFYTSRGDRHVYCSRTCRVAQIKTVKNTECARCGKRFKSRRPDIKHCSEKCRRPAIIIECATCGKSFRASPAELKYKDRAPRRFCSFRCYRRFVGETTPERNARLSLTSLKIKFKQEHAIGRYAVDFYLPDKRIVIEIDEPYWHDKMKERDARKDKYLSARGYDVRRIIAKPLYGKWRTDITDRIRDAIAMPLFASSFDRAAGLDKTVPTHDHE